MPRAFTTRTTGAPVTAAIWALLPSLLDAPMPSNSPMTPSMTATRWPVMLARNVCRTNSSVHIQPSRLIEGRPVTIRWYPGSIKSGPHLKGATVTPRRTSAAMIARLTVVLPLPLCGAAIRKPFKVLTSATFSRRHTGKTQSDGIRPCHTPWGTPPPVRWPAGCAAPLHPVSGHRSSPAAGYW